MHEEYNYDTEIFFELADPKSSEHLNYENAILPTAILEVGTNMLNFPYPLRSGGILKLAIEFYGNCLVEALRATENYN